MAVKNKKEEDMSLTLLLISDLAGKVPNIPAEDLSNLDLVLVAGDITLGAKSMKRTEKTIKLLEQLLPSNIPILLIPGNHDYPIMATDLEIFPNNFIQMHNRRRVITLPIKNREEEIHLDIIGFGGAKIGLYNNFAFSEEEIKNSLEALFNLDLERENTKEINQEKEDIYTHSFKILLVHDPPFSTKLDKTYQGHHVGSKSVRFIIEKYQPDLCVAGHIHESFGFDYIGKTLCVNAGEAKFGQYAIISINLDKDANTIFSAELKQVKQ